MHRAVEHITLDEGGDAAVAAGPLAPRATVHRYRLATGSDGSAVTLSILEGNHLGVRTVGPRGDLAGYDFDLRFADPQPVRVRNVPWAWLTAAAALVMLGHAAVLSLWPAIIGTLGLGVIAGLFAVITGAVTLRVYLRRATESLQFRSEPGGAVLVSVTAGLGGTRAYDKIFEELSRIIVAAKLARDQARPHYLRDAMREHYRLRKLGVLTEKQYESSKAAILAAH